MAQALSHITFIVSNLDAMEQILVEVLDARRVYDSGEATHSLSPERYYLVGYCGAFTRLASTFERAARASTARDGRSISMIETTICSNSTPVRWNSV